MSTRRNLLQALGTGLASSMAVGTVAGQVSKGRQGDGRGGTRGNQSFEQQLDKLRQATERYRDFDKALQDGYKILGPYVPGMGWHMVNQERINKDTQHGPNPVTPPLLTYNLDLELGSVEYVQEIEYGSGYHDGKKSYDIFNDEMSDSSAEEDWHVTQPSQHIFATGDGEYSPEAITKENLLNNDNWYFLSDNIPGVPDLIPGLEAGDRVSINGEELVVDKFKRAKYITSLHVWAHYDNPDGVFTARNPAFDSIYEGSHGGHDHSHHG